MGQSKPPPANIDLVASFVRRRGEEIELVLVRPVLKITRKEPVLILTKGKQSVEGRCTVTGEGDLRRLTVRFPAAEVPDGIWSLVLRPGPGPLTLQARLLVQGDRPLALLMGGRTRDSRLPTPRAKLEYAAPLPVDAGHGAAGGLSDKVRGAARRLRS